MSPKERRERYLKRTGRPADSKPTKARAKRRPRKSTAPLRPWEHSMTIAALSKPTPDREMEIGHSIQEANYERMLLQKAYDYRLRSKPPGKALHSQRDDRDG